MIDWSVVAPRLRSVFSSIALAQPVTPSFLASWAEGRREHRHPEVQKELILRVTRVDEFSADRVYAELPDGKLQERIVGMKEFGLEVRVDSHEHGEEQGRWSWSMIERLRTGLYFESTIASLLEVGVGLTHIGPAIDVSYTFDKRRVNAALFEASFYGTFCAANPIPIDWFERVELTSEIRGSSDELLPSPPNIQGRLVPPLPPGDEPDPSP